MGLGPISLHNNILKNFKQKKKEKVHLLKKFVSREVYAPMIYLQLFLFFFLKMAHSFFFVFGWIYLCVDFSCKYSNNLFRSKCKLIN